MYVAHVARHALESVSSYSAREARTIDRSGMLWSHWHERLVWAWLVHAFNVYTSIHGCISQVKSAL